MYQISLQVAESPDYDLLPMQGLTPLGSVDSDLKGYRFGDGGRRGFVPGKYGVFGGTHWF